MTANDPTVNAVSMLTGFSSGRYSLIRATWQPSLTTYKLILMFYHLSVVVDI